MVAVVEHTRGPWYRSNRWNGKWLVITSDPYGMVPIAYVPFRIRNRSDEEDGANSHLIAAAPEMLAALELSLSVLYLMGDDESHLRLRNEAIKHVEVAIATAREGVHASE